ncbi:hypothetical protein FQA47_013015 [Oryzias melastigma]|uniref:Uncharacterized protein n=1 Tax=Oryzias melastigma TaxID=30732 RepID=A0A834FQH1_ORYME|nr:hypothetical protein FQA47_013015 [Oryzias melastigma]
MWSLSDMVLDGREGFIVRSLLLLLPRQRLSKRRAGQVWLWEEGSPYVKKLQLTRLIGIATCSGMPDIPVRVAEVARQSRAPFGTDGGARMEEERRPSSFSVSGGGRRPRHRI